MVQAHGDRLESLVRAQPIDAVAVLLAEKKVPARDVDGEAPQHRFPRPVGERDHHPGRPRQVYGQRGVQIDPIDLPGGVPSPAVAQHREPAARVEGKLNRARDAGGHDLHAKAAGDLGADRRAMIECRRPPSPAKARHAAQTEACHHVSLDMPEEALLASA